MGSGSAGSVLKVKGGVGGVSSALRSKNWKKEDCLSLNLKRGRETGESQTLLRLWHYNQRLEAVYDTGKQRERVKDTESEDQVIGLHLDRGEPAS